jgi:hypothetical protein
MSDKRDPKELEAVLARLENEWRELANLLKSQPQFQALEVEKILLRDASGKYRGKISVDEDGSAGLLLSDNEGNAWAWLGVNQSGEAFLKLKDHKKEISFKVPASPTSSGAGEEIGAVLPTALHPEAAPPSLESPGAAPQPTMPAEEVGAPPGGPGEAEPPPISSPDEHPGGDVNALIYDRLEKLERRSRRQWVYWAIILAILGLILAAQVFLLFRPRLSGPLEVQSLVVRDLNGALRASLGKEGGQFGLNLSDRQGRRRATLGLAPDGSPGLALYDQDRRLRVELNLGPDGNPKFNMRDVLSQRGQTGPKPPNDSGKQPAAAATVPGSETGAAPSPPAGPSAAVSPEPQPEPEVVYVGSKTSNKYHYPTCKWAKTIRPSHLIKFKSVAEAQAHHYIPCPVCKPPPLSK